MPSAVQVPTVAPARPELWRITDRSAFQELRRHGRRARRGPLTVTWMPPPRSGTGPLRTRAGFTIGKGTGGAVVRNRVRRRLRAALRQLLVEDRLPAGTYLLGGSRELATMPWSALIALVHDTLTEAQR